MKKYLLLPLVALGVIAWAPTQAKAGVHFGFGFGVPGYYEPYYGYYGPYYGYYPGYSSYYYPYGYHRHHYYHHRYWRR